MAVDEAGRHARITSPTLDAHGEASPLEGSRSRSQAISEFVIWQFPPAGEKPLCTSCGCGMCADDVIVILGEQYMNAVGRLRSRGVDVRSEVGPALMGPSA